MGYIFGGNTGIKTAADLERERMLVDALLGRNTQPKSLGQGLSAIGEALGYRAARSRLEKDQTAANSAGAVLAKSLFGGETPVTGPDATPEYQQPEPSAATQPSFGQSILSKLRPAPTPAVDAEMAYDPSRPALPPSPAIGDPAIDPAQAQSIPQPIASPQQVAQATPAPQQNAKLQSLMKIAADPAFEHMPAAAQEIVRKQLEQEVLASDPMRQLQMQKMQQDIASGKYREIGGKLIDMETFQPVYTPPPGADGAEYGLQPIVTQEGPNDPNPGKYHLFQAGKAGQPPKEIQLPYGWTPKNQFLNTGTDFQAVPTQGVPVVGQGPAPVPINNAQAAADTKLGGATGEAAALYESMTSKMPGLEQVVNQLGDLADKATYTQAGQLYNYGRKELGMEPTEGAIARTAYSAMVDNQVLPMLRDTFGAQFTVVEGETLRATLGDPNKTPTEKKAVLKAFIEQKRRNIEAQAKQGNVAMPQTSGKPADWTDEEWNALTPEEKAQFGQ